MNHTAEAMPLPPIQAVHHAAFRCFDAEQTRIFYEDVLGLELAAALRFDRSPTGEPLEYLHLFFRMADGNFIAFFDLPDHLDKAKFSNASGFNRHIALKVADQKELAAYQERFASAGVQVDGPIDHGFVHSIYSYDPNGIQVEITAPAVDHDQVLAGEQIEARNILADWTLATAARKQAVLKNRS